jgi:hypothetical protein
MASFSSGTRTPDIAAESYEAAVAYYRGWDGHPRDSSKAMSILKPLAESECPRAQRLLASLILHSPNHPKEEDLVAVEWLRRSAAKGNAEAFYWLGNVFGREIHGVAGIPKDAQVSAECFRTAAEKFRVLASTGDVEAQFRLGESYDYGMGVCENKSTSSMWYHRAAARGHHFAARNLGVLLMNNTSTEDKKSGVQWMETAAKGGDVVAMVCLGRVLISPAMNRQEEAVDWLLQASKQGAVIAQLDLGRCYTNGVGVHLDLVRACVFWKMAADQGAASAQNCLGVAHHYGQGVPQDNDLAFQWYTKAAHQGFCTAQYNLGVMFEFGKPPVLFLNV